MKNIYITLCRANREGNPIGQIVINPNEILYMFRPTDKQTIIKFKNKDVVFVVESIVDIQEKIKKKESGK